MTSDMNQPFSARVAKLITCILPDNGTDKILMRALREEKQITTISSIACRGIAILQSAHCKHDQIPEATLVKMVKVAVPEQGADELFEYIYTTAKIGHVGGGTIHMGPLTHLTPFELPQDIPDEATL